MYTKVFDIFNNTTPQQGVIKYIELYKKVTSSYELIGAPASLSQICYLSDSNNIREAFLSCAGQFENEKQSFTQTELLMIYLGQMVCYWFLHEYNAVRMLQSAVKKIEYEVSWWEKNKGGLKKVVFGLSGLALAIAGGNPSGGQALFRGGQMLSENDEEWAKELKRFEKIKNAIISINFNL